MLLIDLGPAAPIIDAVVPAFKAAILGAGGLAIGIGFTIWCLGKMWGLFKGLLADTHVGNMTWDVAGSQDVANGHGGGWAADGGAGSKDYSDNDGFSEGDASGHDQSASEQDAAAKSYLDRYR